MVAILFKKVNSKTRKMFNDFYCFVTQANQGATIAISLLQSSSRTDATWETFSSKVFLLFKVNFCW